MLLIHREPLGSGGEGDFVAQPMLVASVILDATVEAVGFSEVETVLLVEGDGGDVEGVGLPRVDAGFHFIRVGDGGEEGFVGVLGGEVLGACGAFDFLGLFLFCNGKKAADQKEAERRES